MGIGDLVPDEPVKEAVEAPKEPAPTTPVTQDTPVASEEKSASEQSPVVATPETSPAQTVQSVTEPSPENPEKSQYDRVTELLLGRIKDPGLSNTYKLCVYGPPGGTKSSFLGQIPGNLVYDMENGLISMRTQEAYTGLPMADGVQALPFKSFAEADFLMERLLADDEAFKIYPVFSIDTFSDFHKRALEDLMKSYKKRIGASFNQFDPQSEHHAENNARMLEFVRRLRSVPKDIVITAHSRTVEPKGKPAKTYPDFSESLAGKIEAMMDVVGYMEMRLVDGKETPVMRVTSEGTIHAKTRIPLEAEIVNPRWIDMKAVWQEWVEKNEANSN